MTTTWDAVRASEAKEWIERTTGEQFPSTDFHESLKSGVLLCKLANKLKPGAVPRINNQRMPFMQMENISAFIAAAKELGVEDQYNFLTVDLFEGKNLSQVVTAIIALKRVMGGGFEKVSGNAASQVRMEGSDQSTENAGQPRKEQEYVVAEERAGTAKRSGQATNTQAFPCCVCTKLISSACVVACGKHWHADCFSCKRCGTKLARAKFYEKDERPYCERCILIINPQTTVRAHTSDKGFSFGN